jgi:hypothetical protein
MIGASFLRAVRCGLAYAWAAPYSLAGIMLGAIGVVAGANVHVGGRTLEFAGGGFGRLASRLPASLQFCAVTLGHVILARDEATLSLSRAHELVHVRQYERWGPFFLPAYFAASLWELARGRRPYRDNCFEREAFACAPRPVAAGIPGIRGRE